MRPLRQEPAEGDRLRVVHVHRHGDRCLHLRLRGGGAQRRGRERVSGFRGRVDGEEETLGGGATVGGGMSRAGVMSVHGVGMGGGIQPFEGVCLSMTSPR